MTSHPSVPGHCTPIERYAAIGDGRTVAMVGADGSVDWWCVPEMDSSPLLDRLLDAAKGAYFSVTPVKEFSSVRRYRKDSNVLETVFTTEDGSAVLVDSLNVALLGQLPWSELARRVEGLVGRLEFRVEFVVGQRASHATPWQDETAVGAAWHVDGVTAAFCSGSEVDCSEPTDHGISASLTTHPGSRHLIALLGAADQSLTVPSVATIDGRIDLTDRAWREWSGSLRVPGPYAAEMRRSALALRLLVSSTTGAIVAAATNGLPERIGGDKNYDYRYAWVRDVTYTIRAFSRVGVDAEAIAAFAWLTKTARRHGGALSTLYTLQGGSAPEQIELDLPGYRGSSPVSQGNKAQDQLQLCCLGDLLETAYYFVRAGHMLDEATRDLLRDEADRCADMWRLPDAGIWELEEPRHYTFSKVSCWAGLDRALSLAKEGRIDPGHASRWRRERDRIRDWIDAECWSDAKQSYTLHAGTEKLDAAMLLAAAYRFDRPERLARTRDAIVRELGQGSQLFRYSGMAAEEGTFTACGFWLVEAYALLGEPEAAERQMQAMLAATGGNLGIMSEQMGIEPGEMLGNTPQALSHLALIHAASILGEARQDDARGTPDAATR